MMSVFVTFSSSSMSKRVFSLDQHYIMLICMYDNCLPCRMVFLTTTVCNFLHAHTCILLNCRLNFSLCMCCSDELKCSMNFGIFLPKQAESAKVPVLYYLSGMCNIASQPLLQKLHPNALDLNHSKRRNNILLFLSLIWSI